MLAFTQASKGLVDATMGLVVPPIVLIIGMQIILLVLGCFMDLVSIMMITIPIFFPIIKALGFNPLWFGILMLLNIEMGPITPPFGLELFVMKGVAKDIPMATIFRGIVPFFIADLFHVSLLVAVPQISLFLPGLMK